MAEETVGTKKKKPKKLSKVMEGSVLVVKELGTNSIIRYDSTKLNAEVQKHLFYHGLEQKIGDAAAGKSGKDAVDSMNKVWEGLLKGDWTVRAPAGEKITKSSVLDKFNAMPEGKAKEQAKAALIALGLMSA